MRIDQLKITVIQSQTHYLLARILLFFVFLIGWNKLQGQDQLPQFKYHSIGINQGLPDQKVYFAYQDKSGYMWFGTEKGLVRFDGFRKEIVTRKDGLPSGTVHSIYEDVKGRIWFVSDQNKLSCFDGKRILKYRFNAVLSRFFENRIDSVTRLFVDSKENILCQIGRSGTVKIDRNGKLTKLVSQKEGSCLQFLEGNYFLLFRKSDRIREIHPVLIEEAGKTREFAYSFLRHEKKIPTKMTIESEVKNRLEIIRINESFFETSKPNEVIKVKGAKKYFLIEKDLWVTTANETFRFHDVKTWGLKKARREKYLPGIKVNSVIRDRENAYWFSTSESGVYYLSNDQVKNIKVSDNPRENNIPYLLFDQKGHLIYGNAKGIFALHDPVPYVLNNEFIYMRLARLKNTLIVYNGFRPLLRKEKILSINFFSDAYNEGDTNLLVCSNNVFRVDENGKIKKLYMHTVGKKWIQRYIGHFESVCSSDKGEIYVGNINGLHQIENMRYHQKDIPPMLRNVRISHIRFSKELGWVIATRGEGVILYKDHCIVKQITTKDGLINDQINKILLEKNGKVCWVATNMGISKLIFLTGNRVRIQNVTSYDGLISNEVNDLVWYKNKIYAATKKGISVFPTNLDFLANKGKRQITLKKVEQDGVEVPIDEKQVVIGNQAKRIVIELKSDHFRTLGKHFLKYRFDKKDKWTFSHSGTIVFYDLNQGQYNLELSYMDKSGVWQKPYFLFTLNKEPKFTETIWFYGLIVVISFLIAFFFIRRRLMQLNKQVEFKRQIQEMEQKALLAQMNPHFIFSALHSIQNFLNKDENELAERYLTKLSQLIRMILVNSREGIVSIEKEIDLLKKYLELEQIRFKNSFDAEFTISIQKSNLDKLIPPMLVQPFVENILIHGFGRTSEKGKIRVNYSESGSDILKVEIEHNGLWFDNPDQSDSALIASERLNLLTEKYRSTFRLTIKKKVDKEGNQSGMKIELLIPIIERESI